MRGVVPGEFLDFSAPPRTYASDELGANYYGMSVDDPGDLYSLRWDIEAAAKIATRQAHRELTLMREERKRAQKLGKALKKIEGLISPYKNDPQAVPKLLRGFSAEGPEQGHLLGVLINVYDAFDLIRSNAPAVRSASIVAPGASRSEPLVRNFVQFLVRAHVRRCLLNEQRFPYEQRLPSERLPSKSRAAQNKQRLPPKNREARFAEYLAAAFHDAGLRLSRRKDDPQSSIGRVLEEVLRGFPPV
jgi:hypothetical protein